MRDKDLHNIAATLFPVAHQLILTQPSNPRAATIETLEQIVPSDFDIDRLTLAPSPTEALSVTHRLTPPDGLICITGSLYLIGEMQALITDIRLADK